MKLEQVVIKNFQSIGKATINLFDRGLVSISGRSLDEDGASSNGAGKSTLINAILWCNYDDPGKKLDSVDDVVMHNSKGGCMAQSLWLDEFAATYYRITRYRKHPLYKNTVTIEVSSDKLTWVDNTKGTSSETQKAINDILGADKLTFEASCFARQDNAPDIPGMSDGELKALLEKVLPFDDLSKHLKAATTNFNKQTSLCSEIKSEVLQLEYKLETISKELEYSKLASGTWLEKFKKELAAEVLGHKQSIQRLGDLIKPPEKVIKALEQFKAKVDGFDFNLYSETKAKHSAALGDVKYLKAKIDRIDYLVKCDACGQSIGDRETTLQALNINLSQAEVTLELIALEVDARICQHDEYLQNKTKLNRLEDIRRQNERYLPQIEVLKQSVEQGERNLASPPANPHEASLRRLQGILTASRTELFSVSMRLKEEEAKLPVLQAVVETFSPKGLRYHILEQVTPALTNRTNYYLSQLTDGAMRATWSTVTKLKSGEYKEKFSISISGTKFKSFGELSGGQKRKVRLSCFFALQDVIASRATKSIDLWCGDEIDHALDAAGLERLMNLLHEKTKTKSTIIVISHNELSEWIPNRTLVTMKDEVSTITGYLSDS